MGKSKTRHRLKDLESRVYALEEDVGEVNLTELADSVNLLSDKTVDSLLVLSKRIDKLDEDLAGNTILINKLLSRMAVVEGHGMPAPGWLPPDPTTAFAEQAISDYRDKPKETLAQRGIRLARKERLRREKQKQEARKKLRRTTHRRWGGLPAIQPQGGVAGMPKRAKKQPKNASKRRKPSAPGV